MEEDRAIDFKALRAKFQDEGLQGRSKCSRPAVAEKPKHVPPSGGHCSAVLCGINMAVESNTPVVPRVFFRDRLRASGDKRPTSVPPQPLQTSPSFELANGDRTTRPSLKDRNMPLVLPVPSVKEQRLGAPSEKELKLELESGKEAPTHDISEKKAMLLPFKSVQAPQVGGEDGEDLTDADLTNRPLSAPGELLSTEKQTEDGVSLQSDQSASEHPLSSPEISIASSSESHADSDNRITSTLEKAMKTFSRGQMFISTKTKTLLSPDFTYRDKIFLSPRKSPEGLTSPPLGLSHLACISARPFFKTSSSSRKSAFDKQLVRDKADGPSVKSAGRNPSCVPLKKPLLDLQKLGPAPAKPPRPPVVDLTCYHTLTVKSTFCLPSVDGSPGETWRKKERLEGPPASNPVLDAPEFPDFENVEVDAAAGDAVDISALELGALDRVGAETHAEFEVTEPALSVCDPAESSKSSIVHGLNLGSPHIIPLDPASFPEPINLFEFPELPLTKQQSHSQEAAVDSYEAYLGVAEKSSFLEEPELRSQTTSNDESRTQPSDHQQDSYYETSDVYEDVGGINRLVSGQISTKRKSKLKNPYADSRPKKEGVYVNKWPRHPWINTSLEHPAHLAHREHLSPSTADHKEQRKREKQRMERERKEQKEREKKENEMKKKFKVNGDEEPMYHARVMVASKVRKNDLPVKSGDTVGIIRTTNCPKGRWLARDVNNKYGYISVMNVELNIQEMLELGKKAQAAGRGGNLDADTISIGSRSSTQPFLTSSFTDDSEEWACEDDTLSPPSRSHIPQQTASEPEMAPACVHVETQPPLNESSLEDLHTQTRHEALQKLVSFFQLSKDEADGGATPTNSETSHFLSSVEEPLYPDTEEEVDFTEVELLPPPPLYADYF
ncbi:uncharacterized protein si:ch211-188c16.1 isoform X1 [Nothobranchius furzeri]|uniref:uncharacterized protein si:ch211-188c16.1 isoform X1 n=1 Tax=Nothobranchius furzeri TaxID=105023 RepID=UPI0039048F0C